MNASKEKKKDEGKALRKAARILPSRAFAGVAREMLAAASQK